MTGRIDVTGLHAALDGERHARGLSWRKLAKLIGVDPSLLSRMGQGHKLDLENFAALVHWLGQPAETFMRDPGGRQAGGEQLALEARLTPLLRADKDLSDEERQYLEQVVTSTITFIRAKRNNATR